jgi:hypothetical protein
MSDADPMHQLLSLSRFAANLQSESLKIQVIKYWSDEMAKPRNADPRRLLLYGFKTYSQNDEDGIIQEIFRRIGTASRSFVEFGVQNGFECNTAKLLIEGWRGLWIESNPRAVAEMRSHFQGFIAGGRLTLVEKMVTAENINATLEQAGVTGEIDLLSVDIDNNDYWVWKAIEVINPRVVVVEYNCALRPPLSLVVPYDPKAAWGGGNYFGASLNALVELGRAKGYRIVGCCFAGVNSFFVREDLCGDFFLKPSTAEEHYEPERYFTKHMPSGHRGRPGYYEAV